MKQNQNKLICETMKDLCIFLARDTKDKKMKKEFEKRARVFKGFAKINSQSTSNQKS